MVQGFFGGFIFGFLGTSMPRLVEASPLRAREAFSLLALFLANVTANTAGWNGLADGIFVSEIALWFTFLKRRCQAGKDRPPPGFVLVGLSFASGLAGTGLHLAGRYREFSEPLAMLARLLSFHAFVLLCILGAGGFLLPRFLGLGVRRKFPESAAASPAWKRAAGVAAAAGVAILVTYALEAAGWYRWPAVARAVLIVAYLAYEMPLERLRWNWRGVQWQLITGLVCVPLGVLAAGWFFTNRVAWLHLELVGGFALITFGVATRRLRLLAEDGSQTSPLRGLREGFAYVWSTPVLRAVMLLAFLVNFAAYPLVDSLLAYVAKNIYGLDQTGLGWLIASFAGGALVGSIAVSTHGARIRPARTMIVCALAWFALNLVFSWIRSPQWGEGVLFAAGFVQSLCMVPMAVILLRVAAPAFRGRVMGVRMLAVYGLPVGLLLSGPLVEHAGFAATGSLYSLIGLGFTLLIAVRWRAQLWNALAAANAR
jgi:hypothetical protein